MKSYSEYIQTSLIQERKIVDYSLRRLDSLPELPIDLDQLSCDSNNLISLPELPKNLQFLYCAHNRIRSLPSLPESLQGLYCTYNQMVSLPELPESLEELYCSHNQLTELPKLPSNLQKLNCFNNPLECLIPEKFYHNQNYDTRSRIWLTEYLQEIRTYSFQKKLLEKDPDQIYELLNRNILCEETREEYKNLIDTVEWGLI